MKNAKAIERSADTVLENLTRTLLYEGYSLYPYYRSALKNQKPIPFGVIFPKDYNAYNEHSNSCIQSHTIIKGGKNLKVSITVRFLHLRKTELFKHNIENGNNDYEPQFSLDVNGHTYRRGWQTIERKLTVDHVSLRELIKGQKIRPLEFESMNDGEFILNEEKEIIAKQTISVSPIKGFIEVKANKVENRSDSHRLTVTVTNTTAVENANMIMRDEALLKSFLSTHIILQAEHGEFISHQDTPEEWKPAIETCNNINTWPILIDKRDTTMLSSPIILYDYPEINALSSGDLFDSTEIEEALLLHVNLLSEEDKSKIGTGDQKINAMLQKVNNLRPEDLHQYHSMMKNSAPANFDNLK